MIKFSKIFSLLLVIVLVVWLMPWGFKFLTASSTSTPFTLYSSVVGDFASIVHDEHKGIRYTDAKGTEYNENQFDSILPFFYYRQLIAEEHLPDTFAGVALTPRFIQSENFMFRSNPSDLNSTKVALYPLLESLSGRVDLEMANDVFRLKDKIQFIDTKSNSVNQAKSQLFNDMLVQKGFEFPAQLIVGNPTTRKEYDEGYLLTDNTGELFHLKQIKSRPYVRHIEIPSDMQIAQMFVTEFKNRRWLAFVVDTKQQFWVLETKTYAFYQVEIPPIDFTTSAVSIIGNAFDWTIMVNTVDSEKLYAVDAQDYSLLASMEQPQPEPTLAQRVGRYLLPIKLTFSSPTSTAIYPRLSLLK